MLHKEWMSFDLLACNHEVRGSEGEERNTRQANLSVGAGFRYFSLYDAVTSPSGTQLWNSALTSTPGLSCGSRFRMRRTRDLACGSKIRRVATEGEGIDG